jgi:hypothetical protein
VSPWRPEIAGIGIAPGRVTLLRRRGRTLTAEPRAAGVATPADIGAHLAALAGLAQGMKPAARADVVVSDAFARYWSFERPKGLKDMDELAALAGAGFEARFGQGAADWRIAFDLGSGAAGGFACALPAALVDGLAALMPGISRGTWSLKPHFCATLDRHAAALPPEAWFAAGADGHVTLARARAGRWASVRVIAADDEAALAQELARERLRSGADDAAPLFATGECGALPQGARRLGQDAWPHVAREHRLALAGAHA